MSTIYTDGANNKYLGDCRWGGHDINYPAVNYLQSDCKGSQWSLGLSNLLDAALLRNGYVIPQSTIDNWGATSREFVHFAPQGDVTSSRFRFSIGRFDPGSGYDSSITARSYYDNGTSVAINRSVWHSHRINLPLSNSGCVSAANSSSLAFLKFFRSAAQTSSDFGSVLFFYAGKLLDVNPNFNYYQQNSVNDVITILAGQGFPWDGIPGATATHFIVGATKNALQSDRAAYTISCSDGQTPGSQWATDMWAYDNNATLGFPAIGRVPNMLLGIGTYTYLKPVKIQGSVFPDGGSPWYLPVGVFAGKTLLMRCYSSMQ